MFMMELVVNGLSFSFSSVDDHEEDVVEEVSNNHEDEVIRKATNYQNEARRTRQSRRDPVERSGYEWNHQWTGQRNQCMYGEEGINACRKSFRNYESLRAHQIKAHENNKDFVTFAKECMNWLKCPFPTCDKIFNTRKSVINHFRKEHERNDSKDYSCPVCVFAAPDELRLAAHITKSHTKRVKPNKEEIDPLKTTGA